MSSSWSEPLRNIFSFFQSIRFPIGEAELSLLAIAQLIAYLVVVFVLVRLLKNFLQQRVLVKLGIDGGNRAAIATIISYAGGALIYFVILQSSGFNLASLAVLAGGLGVGIGFGLQDLTKNFVSGLTLLIERNVKVGDFVEIDDLEGYVEEVTTRSTIIRTRDGAHIVVPNSQLVENRLVNWTYENQTGRISIDIEVDEDSDPLLVTEALLKSAYQEKHVLSDPSPQVVLRGFGDTSLIFALWVWVNAIDKKPLIISNLHYSIRYSLRAYQVELPTPQRNFWINNLNDLRLPSQQNGLAERESAEQSALPTSAVPPSMLLIRDLLKQVPYFQSFSDLELRRVIESGYHQRLKTAEILFQENDPGDTFYIVLAGSVEIWIEKLHRCLSTLEAGQFFGELALLLGIPRTATVKAAEETILFAINQKNFQKILQESPELEEVIFKELSKHQEELAKRQQELKKLGWDEGESNPLVWVRQRLKKIFNLDFEGSGNV
ncbi:MAG: mechanosensitive ion channel domain-containing protein [Cyanophyceae cyanobacterium]